MVLSAKLPFTTEFHYVLSPMMDTLYAVRHTKKNINFGGRENRIQNQDGAPTICVITLVKLLKVCEPQFPHL